MREIKCRGIRLDNGEWFEGSIVNNEYIVGYFNHTRNDYDADLAICECVCHKIDPKTVGQFTGPQDKHGVDIYEGDELDSCGYLGIVFFDELYGSFRVEYENTISDNLFGADAAALTGRNIHQNPELLGGDS